MRRSDGSIALCQLSLILLEDSDPVMAVVTAEDITQRRRTELEMKRLAYRDMLTDLPNRVSLYQEFAKMLDCADARPAFLAVIMIDLDGFKPINDQLGHDAGDEVLRIVGQRITHVNRGADFAARLGGDEFVILMRDCRSAASAEVAAKRLIDAISQPITLQGRGCVLELGASAGVLYLRGDAFAKGLSAESLIKRADIALYRAKHAGRGRVVVDHANSEVAALG